MANLRDKYSVYEVTKNSSVAATLLYGYLGDAVSDEKKMDIMKKLSAPGTVDSGSVEDSQLLYGDKFQKITQKAHDDDIERRGNVETMAGGSTWLQRDMGEYYDNPGMEGPLQTFDEGMRELNELLEEQGSKLDFKDPNAENHFNMLKGFMKDSADGTFLTKMQEDPSYAAANALTAKIGFTSGNIEVNADTKEVLYKKSGMDVKQVLNGTADLGLLEMCAGAVRLQDKTQEAIRTGNVSRQELLEECRQQSQRQDKEMQMSEKRVEELQKANILQNDRDEFTDGPRGILYAVDAVKANQEVLQAGYPVEDMSAMSAFYVQTGMLSRVLDRERAKLEGMEKQIKELEEKLKANPSTEKEKADYEKNKATYEKTKQEKEASQAKIGKLEKNVDQMRKAWQEVTDTSKDPLTQEKRQENLGKLKACAENVIASKAHPTDALNGFSERVDKRMNAQLGPADKALLGGDCTAMYNALNETDPRTLFSSSKQFREMKKSMKELADMEKGIAPEERFKSTQLLAKKRQVMEKAQDYLRYKNRQMNGPNRGKHKRSELETRRVQAADALYNRLLSDVTRQSPATAKQLRDSEKAITAKADNQHLLGGNVDTRTVSYDNYIKLHTGVGSMNGTPEEMVDDMAKVMAAGIMPKQKPPKEFDPKAIHVAAEQIKDKFNLRGLEEAEVRNALKDPESVRKLAQEQHRKTYSVDKGHYGEYLSDMRKLYANMKAPDGTDKEYQKIFDSVKKAAHLPKDPDKAQASTEKLQGLIEQTNSEIFEAMDRYVDKNAMQIGPQDDKMLQVLSVMEEAVPNAKGRTNDMVGRIRDAKGITNIGDPNYIELEEYGLDRKAPYRLEKNPDPNQMSKEFQDDLCKSIRLDVNGIRKDLSESKQQAKEKDSKTRAKEAEPKSKKKLEPVEEKKSPKKTQPQKKAPSAGPRKTL